MEECKSICFCGPLAAGSWLSLPARDIALITGLTYATLADYEADLKNN